MKYVYIAYDNNQFALFYFFLPHYVYKIFLYILKKYLKISECACSPFYDKRGSSFSGMFEYKISRGKVKRLMVHIQELNKHLELWCVGVYACVLEGYFFNNGETLSHCAFKTQKSE